MGSVETATAAGGTEIVSGVCGSSSNTEAIACMAGFQTRVRIAPRNSAGILWENIASKGTTSMQVTSTKERNFMGE